MPFRLSGIDPAPFAALFALDDDALAQRGVQRCRADRDSGFPCRISLEDARVGEELLLLPYEHQPAHTPYRASGPVFIRRGVQRSELPQEVVPPYVARRLMSLRAYSDRHWMVDAEVCEGGDVARELARMFGDATVAYVHLHNARRGCFSCVAHRA
ncbi:DUF1203 domain-containing protein [Luteimonas kalidii]|uniref:DUF1203 domain-containing protein n=1 Tax=Luteimonas kalidii TaxID=3042025 RepID=A0ABT6JV14_9GAMM|nr:DUF1203 domain-containing protein [Luteimonas kalidii]MDH5834534.1 DUF1203 domain-containing protein [Luteimonas kalidii]